MKRSLSEDESSEASDTENIHDTGDASKAQRVDGDVDQDRTSQYQSVTCYHPPACNLCPKTFPNITAYESHFHTYHSNVCFTCRTNLPSPRLLELHLAENHDPFWSARKAKGESVYGCFVEGCPKMYKSWKKRIEHLVGKHEFLREYNFNLVNFGLSKSTNLLTTPNARKADGPWRRQHAQPKHGGSESPRTARNTKSTEGSTEIDKPTEAAPMAASISQEENMAIFRHQKQTIEQPRALREGKSRKQEVLPPGAPEKAAVSQPTPVANKNTGNDDLAGLTKAMSTVSLIPRSVRPGKGR
ncbi:hypothetical protein SAICODRAFT_66091 [Saitoella complicata NRRL Y-17804]|uniref:C2H2-type domain-containing protein n=1 Tax=Saitoella complicata (strain BCRC 22490 / CBS 7301 / JCM 7358 / NBRC 10748 / NRRL Y-17804) TaxID=698492 RepID=A0A0E9NKU0_SAICN|nr:uncharacterized protein SAICODRAFT_66091 [Saitoella complicata NRRL Y-17804]ODQ52470.1 hypothetical protein SAICODRAFT_66091 [Saitoella complicata NRRL Y-17804]GAO50492.1 hypothetical protein G7K_4616-t1 [Saitoella complicata NRRL Y-17804]